MEITCMKFEETGHFAKRCQTKGVRNFAKSRKKIEYAPPTIKEFMNGMRAATVRQQTVKQY